MATIAGVTISMVGGASFCSLAGTTTSITFRQNSGNLPLISVAATATSGTVTATVVTGSTIEGTTDNAVCSNRGLCDTGVGVCECFTGYGSSDGDGGSGTLPDCGYNDPAVADACPTSTPTVLRSCRRHFSLVVLVVLLVLLVLLLLLPPPLRWWLALPSANVAVVVIHWRCCRDASSRVRRVLCRRLLWSWNVFWRADVDVHVSQRLLRRGLLPAYVDVQLPSPLHPLPTSSLLIDG